MNEVVSNQELDNEKIREEAKKHIEHQNKKFFITLIVSLIILFFVFIGNIFYGTVGISFFDTVKAIFNVGDETTLIIVREIRMPRAVVALVCGATLAASGVLIKAVMRNPLADSGLLGIQSGATVVAMFIILVNPALIAIMPIAAFIGGLIAFGIIMLLSYNNGISAMRMILAGIAVNSLFGSVIGLITIYQSDKIQNALGWLNGSLANLTTTDMYVMLVYGILALVIGVVLLPFCNLMQLDDATLVNLGVNVSVTRLLISIGAVLLASVSVAIVGIIGFVGLVVPHIARLLVGTNHYKLFPISIIFGSILVLGADLLQKILFSPMEMPVGIVISMLGAPFFLYLLRKEV